MAELVNETIVRASESLGAKIGQANNPDPHALKHAEQAKVGHVGRYIRDQKVDQLIGEAQTMIEQGKSKEEIETFLKDKAKLPEGDISKLKDAKNVAELKAFMAANPELTESYYVAKAAEFLLKGGTLHNAGKEIKLLDAISGEGESRTNSFKSFRADVQREIKAAEEAIVRDYARLERLISPKPTAESSTTPITPTITPLAEVAQKLNLPVGASLEEVTLQNGTKITNFSEANLKSIKEAIERKEKIDLQYKLNNHVTIGSWDGEKFNIRQPVALSTADAFGSWLAMQNTQI